MGREEGARLGSKEEKKRSNFVTQEASERASELNRRRPRSLSSALLSLFLFSLARSHVTETTNNETNKTKIPYLFSSQPAAAAAAPPSETSGLRHLGPDGVARATDPKANPFEKKKNAKSGAQMWTEVYELAELLKSGKSTWEDLDLDDVDMRLKASFCCC